MRSALGKGVPAIALLAWAVLATPPLRPGNSRTTPADVVPRRFSGDDDEDEDGEWPHLHWDEEMGGQAERGKPETWLVKGDITREYLLEVQALIVKDEMVTGDCEPSDQDLRKANWRHFMCYGSILSQIFILTSASCIHEALYIRHNIQATLATVIAPVFESIQVIKISQYIIHPKLDVDPRHTDNYVKYDLAIAKLSCKISKKNLFPIELPTKPLRDICKGDNCYVSVIKRKEDGSHLIFQYLAKDIEDHKLIARQADILLDINRQDIYNVKQNDNKKEKADKRMCTKTGSAVMARKIQAGIVALSCDIRQPDTPWLYTDLYDNVEWIVSIADIEMPKPSDDNTQDPNDKSSGKCSTCIYNIYFDWKQKNMCPNKIINDLGDSLPACKNNSTEPESTKKTSHNISGLPKDDYLKALDVLYHDQSKHFHQGGPISPPEIEELIDDKMIPVDDDFEVNSKTNANGKDEKQNVKNENRKTKPDNNIPSLTNKKPASKNPVNANVNKPGNAESEESSNEKVDKETTNENSDVPEEYKNLYDQYLREFQLRNN